MARGHGDHLAVRAPTMRRGRQLAASFLRKRCRERLPFFPVSRRRCRYAVRHCGDGLMPLFRYFLFTGALLLGLLFVADWYFPAPPAAVARNHIDRATIRIHSRHQWPEAIRMDTSASLVTASPAPSAPLTAQAPAPRPAAVAKADPPRSPPSKALEQIARHAKPPRHAQGDRSPRFAQRGQRVASYRDPEWQGGWQGWSFPRW